MSQIQKKNEGWRTRVYVVGVAGGALFGVVAALLYARAAEEGAGEQGNLPPIPTGTLIGLILSALALIRQITEAGKPSKK
jgi:hypothetical protein